MANRYWTHNSDRKITAPLPPKDKRGGGEIKVSFTPVKQYLPVKTAAGKKSKKY